MKKLYLIIVLLIIAVGIAIGGAFSASSQQTEKESVLYISEVCSNNKTVFLENWGITDYFELYNSSEEDIDMAGYYMWDGKDSHEKYYMDGCTIAAQNYLLLPYTIKKTGEEIGLFSPDGELLDSVVVPQLIADEAYCRNPNNKEEWGCATPTPNTDNAEIEAETPVFSKEAGLYDEAFILELSAEEGATIYYTLDGTDPTTDSECYTGEISVEDPSDNPNKYKSLQNVIRNWLDYEPDQTPVDKAFVVKAIAVVDGKQPSKIKTASYLIDKDQYSDYVVVSITSDPDNLFGDEGICVTGKAYDDWYLNGQVGDEPSANFYSHETEVPVHCEMFYDGVCESQDVGMKIQGNSTRKLPTRRFALYARDEYSGSDYFDSDLFGFDYHSIVLRDPSPDVIAQKVILNATDKVGGQDAKKAIVFLEGEYWYTTYIRPKYSERFLETKYGVDKDNIEMAEAVPQEIYDFLDAHPDLSNQEDYDEFCKIIDIESYIDYEVSNIYMNNMDASESANTRLWRAIEPDGSEYGDGRWRWLVYDMDAMGWTDQEYYGVEYAYQIDSFTHERMYTKDSYLTDRVFAALFKNESFKQEFYDRFVELADTGFSAEEAEPILKEYEFDLTYCDSFFVNRREYIQEYIDKVYGY